MADTIPLTRPQAQTFNLHCRMMAALIHDCARFFDPPEPRDASADWMISCTIQHWDLFHLPDDDHSELFFNDTSHYISLPFDELPLGTNAHVWLDVDEEWMLHIINLVILRDMLSVHSSSDPIIFQDLRPVFIRIIEDVRQELHVFLHDNEGDVHSNHIRNLRDTLGRLFPFNSSTFQRPLLHAYRFPDESRELRRLADVSADNEEVLRRDRADETLCQCQTQRCLILDVAHALLEWIRDGDDSYGRSARDVRGPTSAAFSDPFTRKLLAARDLSCGLINGGDMFTLTYRTIIEHYLDCGGELSDNAHVLDVWHLFNEGERAAFLAIVENIKSANQDEDVDALIRELESVIDMLERLSEVCPDDVQDGFSGEEQGDVPPVEDLFPHDLYMAPNFNVAVNPPSDSESDDDTPEQPVFHHTPHVPFNDQNDPIHEIHGLLKNNYMRGRRRRIAGINWDMRFPPTRRYAHYSDCMHPALQDVWHASAFLPATSRVVELKSDHPSLEHLFEKVPLRIYLSSSGVITVEDVLYALYDYLQTRLSRDEELHWGRVPGNARKMRDAARERAHVVRRRGEGSVGGGGDGIRRLDLLNKRHWFDGLRLENRGGVMQVFVDVSRV